jgi:hypothetical protein
MLILATGSSPQVVLTDADKDRAIEVVVATTIVIELKTPPSPGLLHRWPGNSSNENVLQSVHLGASSTATPLAEFRAVAPGRADARAFWPGPPDCACIPAPIGVAVTVLPPLA